MTAATAVPSVGIVSDRPRLRHMPGLDGLRGLAVAGVLLFHAGHLTGGFLGVDLFFVLSGFLITSLLLREQAERHRIDLSTFWVRRARRLLPALGGVLLGVALYAWLVADPAELGRIRGDGLATVAYVANWRSIFAATDYWDLFTSPSPLQHMWSVAIEEQFYLVWPLVVVGLVKWRGGERLARSVFATASLLALGSLGLMMLLHEPGDRTRVYFGTDTRASSILVGVALAAWIALRGPARSVAGHLLVQATGVGAAVILAVAWIKVDGRSEWLYNGGMFALALAAVAVIAAIATPERSPIGRALSVAPMRWLGLISYGVYLWHWPVYVVLDTERTGFDGWVLTGLRVGVTLAVAIVSYVALEQPIRHGWAPSGRLARQLLAPVTVVAVVATLLFTTTGAVEPVEMAVQPDGISAAVDEVRAAPAAADRVLVIGNSVGLFLGEGFEDLRVDPPVVGVNRSLVGCTYPTPTDVRLSDGSRFPEGAVDCTTTWADDVEALEPELVVFPFVDPGDADYQHDGQWLHPCMPAYDEWMADELHRSVDVLSSTGAEVALVAAPYSTYYGASDVRFARTDCVNRVLGEVAAAREEAVYVDLARYVCPTPSTCHRELDGITLRPDGVHFKDEGARHVARWILGEVRRGVE